MRVGSFQSGSFRALRALTNGSVKNRNKNGGHALNRIISQIRFYMNALTALKIFKSMLRDLLSRSAKTLGIGKVLSRFLENVAGTIVAIRGRVNFLQLQRYSGLNEKTFRNNFSRDGIDWLRLNKMFISGTVSPDRLVIAMDPAHISKSGRCTPGIGMYWSGASSKSVHGLELTAFAAIDYVSGDCVMLGASQTLPGDGEGTRKTMTECYLDALKSRREELLKISDKLVADAFFSRKTFALEAVKMGFTLISKFPGNASLSYLANEPYLEKRGTRKGYKPTYAGRVDIKHPDMMFCQKIRIDGIGVFHTAVVHSTSLRINVRIVIGRIGDRDNVILFSTDPSVSAADIVSIYRKRFRIEFGIRDAKQFTGLSHNQSRNTARIDFAYNISFFTRNMLQSEIDLFFPKNSVGQLKKAISDTVFALKILDIGDVRLKKRQILQLEKLVATYIGAAA